ncbi:gliding motility protein RemB [Pedobacter sp. PAMC26386]|nr:gliding motility protein RemB [Pedobacter sp. PAMC26386]
MIFKFPIKPVLVLLFLSQFAVGPIFAQSIYSYQFYQKLNTDIYSTKNNEHTSLRPFLLNDSISNSAIDSLLNYRFDEKSHSAAYNKLFNSHLIDIKTPRSTFYADLLPDFSVGRDFSGHKTTGLGSMGLQIGGTISKKLQYYVSGYVSRASFSDYMNNYINQVGIIPGQAYARYPGKSSYDWSYISASVSYTPMKYLTVSAGRDKTFIGDGYRSLLLSDYASPYPFFKLTGTLGNVRYMAMWTYMNDPATTSQYQIDRKKFGVFHYLDWSVNKRLSIGFFENIMGFYTDDNGAKRPFDFNYINPVIFMKPVNNTANNPDKSLLGITSKYKINDNLTVYGQFALNEFRAKDFFSSNGSFGNKYGWQLGVRGSNLLKVKGLNYLLETNSAKPYTYASRSAISNYSSNGEPLAHPWGGNFREVLGLLNYTYKRFDFSGEVDYGRYGYDINGLNYGKNIFKIYTDPARFLGNYTGQGLTTNMIYLEGKVAFLVNPKYNLRLELGGIFRNEKNDAFTNRATLITFGLRSSFRNIYNDLTAPGISR